MIARTHSRVDRRTQYQPSAAEIAEIIADKEARIVALETELASLSQAEHRSPAPAAASGCMNHSNSKPMTKGELDSMVDRLTRAAHHLEPDTSSVARRVVIDADAKTAMVARLADDDVHSRMEKMKEKSGQQEELLASVQRFRGATLNGDEVGAMATRLSRDAIERKRKFVEEQRAELLRPVTASAKTISKDCVAACAARLHDESMIRKEKVAAEMAEKYLKSTPKKVLSDEQRIAMANRLSTKRA